MLFGLVLRIVMRRFGLLMCTSSSSRPHFAAFNEVNIGVENYDLFTIPDIFVVMLLQKKLEGLLI